MCFVRRDGRTLLLVSGQRLGLRQHACALRFHRPGPRSDRLARRLYRCISPAQKFSFADWQAVCQATLES